MQHRSNMPLDPQKLQKPFRKLRKSLKNLSRRPSPEEVHDLRTRTRQLEAILHALLLDRQKPAQRLLGSIAPIRKRAGKVRDMDVLTGFAAGLTARKEEECRLQLIEALSGKRQRFERKLNDTGAANRSKACRYLKRYSTLIDRKMTARDSRQPEPTEWPGDAMAVAFQLSSELARWPTFNAGNIHPWRLKIKELRYILQLAEDSDSRFVEALGEAKDAIGEWHDWTELETLAKKGLDHGTGCQVLKEIHSTAQEKLKSALVVAERLRRTWLPAGRRSRRAPHSSAPRVPTLITTAKLAS
jgi:CHAD domain-containing protein